MCVCILRGLCNPVSSAVVSLLNNFKGKGLYITVLWRRALAGNVTFGRLTLGSGVKMDFVQHLVYFPPGKGRFVTFRVSLGRKSPPKSLWKRHHLSQRRESLHAKMRCLPGLPWWLSGKEPACQGRRHGFGLWSRKIPHATEQLTPSTTTFEPVLWSPGATATEAHVP